MTKKNQKVKLKKAPMAPKRFKSAYMFYSEIQHREIRRRAANKKLRAADIAKMVSKAWKELPDHERCKFQEMARLDRERYDHEKAAYKGPWKILDVKDPDAPKKPMSAFLAFSNERRKAIAQANPSMNGTEISCLLSKLWKECPAHVKQAYRDREVREREAFKRERAEWERQQELGFGIETSMLESYATTSQDALDTPCDRKCAPQNEERFVDEAFNVTNFPTTEERPANFSPVASYSPCLQTFGTTVFPPVMSNQYSASHTGMINLPFLHESQRAHPPVSSVTSRRFENYSMEDILQDDELFEDFSPLHVQSLPKTAVTQSSVPDCSAPINSGGEDLAPRKVKPSIPKTASHPIWNNDSNTTFSPW